MKSLIAIDVGMSALGWARWEKIDKAAPTAPDECGVIKVPNKVLRRSRETGEWIAQFSWIMDEFRRSVYERSTPSITAFEWPEFRAASAQGHAAAARDNLTQLAFAGGCHAEMAFASGSAPVPVPVSAWKGTLKKEVVTRRIQRAIGATALDLTPIESHAWDAVGIGLFVQGHRLDGRWFA